MQDYFIIIDIIGKVLDGKNLTETFDYSINKVHNIAKVKDISFNVFRYYFELSLIINKLIKKNIENKTCYIVLLIAIYEIKYSKKAQYAIVNDLVNITQSITKHNHLKNFVNAIIRSYIRNSIEIEQSLQDKLEYKYNYPLWWIDKIIKDYKEAYPKVLINTQPKICLRINNQKINTINYIQKLQQANIKYVIQDNKIVLNETISIDSIPLFKEGFVSIQNINAQKIPELININKNDLILDACSAPGGKTCQILENYSVKLVSLDINERRILKIEQNLTRLNLKTNLIVGDASNLKWWDGRYFDKIIADVPCSASGTVKKNPDIKYHRKPIDINNFVSTQKAIIENLWQILKVGGEMLYITCSVFKEENENNIDYFIQKFRNAKIIKQLYMLPDEIGDGLYYCALKKDIK